MSTNTSVSKFNYSLLLLLFPILPQYIYVIGGVNLVNSLVILFLIGVILSGKVAKINITRYLPFFWIYEIARAVLTISDAGAIRGISYFLSFFIIPYLLIGYIKSDRKFYEVLDIIILGGLLLGIFGIIEQITRFNIFQYFSNGDLEFSGHVRYGLLRVMTTFGQPIGYGLYQVFISALVFYRLNTNSERHRKSYYVFVYIVSVVNIFLSVSRTPFLAFILVQALLIYQKSKKRFYNFAFGAFLIMILAGLINDVTGLEIPLINDLIQTFTSLFQGVAQTSEQTVGFGDRFSLWIWVTNSMNGNWIFGNGASAQFAYEVHEWQIKTSIENHYLYIMYHFGLTGLILLIAMYLSALFFLDRMDRGYGNRFNESRFSFNKTMFVVFLVYCFIELSVQETDLSRLYVVLVALIISYNKVSNYHTVKYDEMAL